MPLLDSDAQSQLLTLACRFMPYDQWLTTHVDPSWKIKQVKLWVLSKCLGISFDPALHASASHHGTAMGSTAHTSSAITGTPPGPRYRPASPITFAPDPRRRPISPILFAKTTEKERNSKGKGVAHDVESEGHTSTVSADDTEPPSSSVDGYEEDDEEWEMANETMFEEDESSPPSPLPLPLPIPIKQQPQQQPQPSTMITPSSPPAGKWSKFNTSPAAYSLLRFSTGQLLEDDLPLSMYDLAPYELLELHAHCDVYAVPSAWATSSASTRPMMGLHPVATGSEHSHGGHARSSSIYSLSLPPSSAPKDNASPLHVYLPPLNRSALPTYILPYWEGHVRALRYVSRAPALEPPIATYANGYGYGYGGAANAFVDPKAVIGQPPPLGVQLQGKEYTGMRGAGGWDASVGMSYGEGSGVIQKTVEWRTRWLVIKEGVLSLFINREDDTPNYVFPLTALTALYGVEHLSAYLRQHLQHGTLRSTAFDHAHRQGHHYTSSLPTSKQKTKSMKKGSNLAPSIRHSRPSTSTFVTNSEAEADSEASTSHEDTDRHHKSKDTDYDDDDEEMKMIGGEPIENLRIVCIRYRSVDRLKQITTVGPDGVTTFRYVSEKESKRKEAAARQEKQNNADATKATMTTGVVTSSGPAKAKKVKKQKKETGSERDDKKGKGRGMVKPLITWENKPKEKPKPKDWISAFSVSKNRDHHGRDKGKDKERAYLSGMGVGLGLSLGLSVGMQDPPDNKHPREHERDPSKEMPNLSEADAEAGITFARRSMEGLTSSSEEETGALLNQKSTVEETGDNTNSNEPRDDSGDEEPPSKIDKGKNKATDLYDADEDEDGPTVENEGPDVNGEVEPQADSGSDSSIAPSRDEPRLIRDQSVVIEQDNPEDENSDAWSSPIFAHSGDSSGVGSDENWSELGGPVGKSEGYKRGYRYGYRYKSTRSGLEGPDLRLEHESLQEEEDRLEKERANLERRKAKERQKREEAKRKENERTEWIVLDMGNDYAYSSFLRILHRHLTPEASSHFVGTHLAPEEGSPSSTPTPNRTPFPSPTSPKPPQPPAKSDSQSTTMEFDNNSTSMTSLTHLAMHMPREREPPSPASTSSQSDRFNYEVPRHPPDLAALSHPLATAAKAFGVLPYPEWRIELTERAQRAGMGDVGRAMRWVLWQNGLQLDLDLEEVRSRHGTTEEASAEIRRKRRETVSMKNRRRSTTSRTSTVTGGSKKAPENISSDTHPETSATACDSDVSEDTGKMIEMSDSEENSEAEWQGWMADLRRQRQGQLRRKQEDERRRAEEAAREAQGASESDDDELLEPPKNPEEDRKHIRELRMRREPRAVVYTDKKPITNMSTPSGTLYSPSSSESLSHQRRAMSFSPVGRPSSPVATSSQSYPDRSDTTSPLGHRTAIPTNSGLSHSTSMYAPGLRSNSVAAEVNMRRPSMPILAADQTFSLQYGGVISPRSSVVRSPMLSNFSFPTPAPVSQPLTQPPPFSPNLTSNFPRDDDLPRLPAALHSHNPSFSSPPGAMPRRASSAGLSGSLGRTSSVLSRGGLLKKDNAKEADRLKEKEKRTREKEEKNRAKQQREKAKKDLERDARDFRKLQRPKLSLATSSTHQLVPQPATSQARSTATNELGRSLMRRVKSGSSLSAAMVMEENVSSTRETDAAPKKKRTVLVNRFVRGLGEVMDFADGK